MGHEIMLSQRRRVDVRCFLLLLVEPGLLVSFSQPCMKCITLVNGMTGLLAVLADKVIPPSWLLWPLHSFLCTYKLSLRLVILPIELLFFSSMAIVVTNESSKS